MYVKTRCLHCNQKLKVRKERLGSTLRCPRCGNRFTFDSFEPPTSEHAPAPDHAASDGPEPLPAAALLPGGADADTLVQGSMTSDGMDASSRASSSGGTNASFFISFILGAILTAAFYAPLWGPFHQTKIGILFTERGWVQYAIVFLTAWAASILLLKLFKLRKQTNSLLFDLLPREISTDIRPDNADAFRSHILDLPVKPSRSFLASRVLRALEHLKFRGNVQEVSNLLESQADLQTAAMDTSYTMVRVFIWAVPILGFIGTVIGISDAVNQFSSTIQGAQDVGKIQESLKGVTTGLAVAFDTTLVALVMSIILMFPTNWLQKSEEEFLSSISDYCNEELLSRLDDGKASKEESTHGGLARGWAHVQKEIQDIQSAQAREQREAFAKLLKQQGDAIDVWAGQLKETGTAVANQLGRGWKGVQEFLEKRSSEEADHLDKVIAETAAERKAFAAEVVPAYREHAAHLQEVGDAVRETATKVQAEISALQVRQAQNFKDVCADLAGSLRRIQEEARSARMDEGKALQEMVGKCADGIASVAAEGQAMRTNMTEALESVAPALRDALERLSRELAGDLKRQLGGIDRLSAAVASNAGKVAAGLEALRKDEAERLEKAVGAIEKLSSGVKNDLPAIIASHSEALQKSLGGYVKLVQIQQAISRRYESLAKSDTLPRTVSTLADHVAKLGPIFQRVEKRLDGIKPQRAGWRRMLGRKGNGTES